MDFRSPSGIRQIITRSLLLIQKGGPRGFQQKKPQNGPRQLSGKGQELLI